MNEDILKLKVGVEILMKVETSEEDIRKTGTVLGWVEGEMIIVEIPQKKNMEFYDNAVPLLVGFVNEGVTYGFKSKLIIKFHILNRDIFMLEYPEETRRVKLRKEERYRVQLPATFRLFQENASIEVSPTIDCSIVDINNNGCAMMSKLHLKKGDKLFLSFILPPQGNIVDLPCQIMNARPNIKDKSNYGIKFYPGDHHKEYIDRFLTIVDKIKQMIRIEGLDGS
jgi:hypothetical protein